jgi:hypothetical protein
MSKEKLKTPDDLLRKELNEHGKTLGKKKPCKTCKKKKKLDLGGEIEIDQIYNEEDIRQVYGYLTENSKLTDPNIAEFSKKLFKEVTGQDLDVNGCMGCKAGKWKRLLKFWSEKRYNVIL